MKKSSTQRMKLDHDKHMELKKFEAPWALIYCAIILTFMEYAFIPPRAEAWLNGPGFFGWVVPTMNAGLIWSGSCLLFFMFLPLAFTVYFNNTVQDFGMSLKGLRGHLKVYLGLYALMIPLIYLASRQPHFKQIYPFVPEAALSTESFLLWELAYVAQFFALESFFRGYLLFTLNKHVDRWLAISIMIVPYVMIHFHKPIFETLGAVVAGVVLGHLALKYRSWIGGAILHSLVAVTLDFLAMRS